MANKLIGEDCLIQIHLGGVYDGSLNPSAVPNIAAVVSIKGICRRISLKGSIEKTNVKAMGDYAKQNRYHSSEGSLEIETFVPSTGFGAGANLALPPSAVGSYITVVYSPLTTLANPQEFVGVVTEWDTDAAVASEQSVKITVDLNPDFLNVTA